MDLFPDICNHCRPLIGPLKIINNARGAKQTPVLWDVKSSTVMLPLGSNFKLEGRTFDLTEVCPFGHGETDSLGCHCRLCLHRNTWFGGLVFQKTAETSKSIGCLGVTKMSEKTEGCLFGLGDVF